MAFTLSYGDTPRIMGVLNVTPDSFYDGGRHNMTDAAVKHGLRLLGEGASILDIGGESTRPGADPVPLDTELRRVIPVIEELAGHGAELSVDTRKSEVARRAMKAGACMINDVSAGTDDPDILGVAADSGAFFVAMHMRGNPKTMQADTRYENLVAEIVSYFEQRIRVIEEAGIVPERIVLDPGIGFGKAPAHNYTLIARGADLHHLGKPLLFGPSRKSFLRLAGGEAPENRLPGTIAAVTICTLQGVELIRVHDVFPAIQALKVALMVREASKETDTVPG